MTIMIDIPDADYASMVAVQDPTIVDQLGGADIYMRKLCVSMLHHNWKERTDLLIQEKSNATQLAIVLTTSYDKTASG